jgi:hypothetical protein
MNWFSLVSLILAMSPHIVQAVEVLASHKAANGTPLSSADKASAGVQLGQVGLVIAGAATGQITSQQVGSLIQTINDGTVAQNNAAEAAVQNQQAAPVPAAPGMPVVS